MNHGPATIISIRDRKKKRNGPDGKVKAGGGIGRAKYVVEYDDDGSQAVRKRELPGFQQIEKYLRIIFTF